MAIAYNTTGSATTTASGGVATVAYTMGSGTNYGALISVFQGEATPNPGETMTYGGASCTKIADNSYTNGFLSLWRIENPSSGCNNIVYSGIDNVAVWFGVMEYTGVNQTAMTYDAGVDTTQQATGTTISNTITINGTDSWSASVVRNSVAFGVTANSGVTRRFDEQAPTQHAGGDSNATVSGSNSHVWNVTSGISFSIMVELQNAAGGGGSSIKTFNGLAYASTKTVDGLAIASVKTWNGLA